MPQYSVKIKFIMEKIMKNKLILLSPILLTSFLYANDAYTEFDYQEELSSKISKVLKDVKQLHLKNRESYISKENKIITDIEDKQRVKFILKDYKKLDVYVRENYTVINNDYILKNPAGWRRVLIKQTNIWE